MTGLVLERFSMRVPRDVFFAVVGCVLFSSLDALFTLMILSDPLAYEANPMMSGLVEGDARHFVVSKLALTSLSLILLVLVVDRHAFGFVPVKTIIFVVFAVYWLLMAYHSFVLSGGFDWVVRTFFVYGWNYPH